MMLNIYEHNNVAYVGDEMGLPISLRKASEALRILQAYIDGNTEETIQKELETDLLDRFPGMYELVTGKKSPIDPGYVYLMYGKGTSWYKIGKTSSVPTRRNALQLLAPFDVEIIAFYKSNQVSSVENSWHKRFSDKHVNGEWYALSKPDVMEFVYIAERGG